MLVHICVLVGKSTQQAKILPFTSNHASPFPILLLLLRPMSNALTRLVHHIAYDLLIPETSQRLVSTAALGSLRAFEFAEDDNSFSSRPSNSSTIYSSAASLFRRLSASKAAQPFKTSLPRTISTTEPISKELESPSELRIGSLKDYIGLRKRNVAGVLDLSPRDWLHIISWATGANGNEVDQSMLNDIAKDLVRTPRRVLTERPYRMIKS
ncbi:hypothetical protein FRC03_009638 [Tulasnella sp. 419]|nr:hypothetical protein FRC03_009638 [Tulasnella sp. 419]